MLSLKLQGSLSEFYTYFKIVVENFFFCDPWIVSAAEKPKHFNYAAHFLFLHNDEKFMPT